MVLRFVVMPARSSTSCATLPVNSPSKLRKSSSNHVVLGATRHETESLVRERVAKRFRVRNDLRRIDRKTRLTSPRETPLPSRQ